MKQRNHSNMLYITQISADKTWWSFCISVLFMCVSDPGGPPDWQGDPVPCQAKVHPDCVSDILDREEAAPAVGWNSLGCERLPMPTAAGGGDPLCPALCPSAAPLLPAHLPGGVPQASAQLARPRRYRLSLPGLNLLPADERKSGLCSEDSLCKRVTGLVGHAWYLLCLWCPFLISLVLKCYK